MKSRQRLVDANNAKYIFDFTTEETVYSGKEIEKGLNLMKSINAVEIPNNATNGDIIKTLFSNHCLKMWTDYKQIICFDFEDVKYWWNSPYEGGISNEVCD